jgi:hypothetical protein
MKSSPQWVSILGVQIGCPKWVSILGVHIGCPCWVSILGVHIGCPYWVSILCVHIGAPYWGSKWVSILCVHIVCPYWGSKNGGPKWGYKMGVQIEGPKWGSKIGVQNGGPNWGSKMGVHNEGPYWGSKMGVQNGGGVHIGGPFWGPYSILGVPNREIDAVYVKAKRFCINCATVLSLKCVSCPAPSKKCHVPSIPQFENFHPPPPLSPLFSKFVVNVIYIKIQFCI